jgi:mannose-6-phosphate isomerase-like protein (cupin superfamily)
MVGKDSPVKAGNFVMGRVLIDPQGKVPLHHHGQEEVYYIVRGTGRIQVDHETESVRDGSVIYIDPEKEHELVNTGSDIMEMIFVYSPAGIVSHWKEEKQGIIK